MAGSGASLRSLYRVRKEFSAKRLLVVRESISALNARTWILDIGHVTTRQDKKVALVLVAVFE